MTHSADKMLLGLPGEGAEKALAYIAAQKDITVEEVPDYHVRYPCFAV